MKYSRLPRDDTHRKRMHVIERTIPFTYGSGGFDSQMSILCGQRHSFMYYAC
jgi:hypothetical protein